METLDHALSAFDDFHLQVGDGRVGFHPPDRSLALFSVGRFADEKALRFQFAAKMRAAMRVVRDEQNQFPIDYRNAPPFELSMKPRRPISTFRIYTSAFARFACARAEMPSSKSKA